MALLSKQSAIKAKLLRFNPPEITNNEIKANYYAEDMDVFASASVLFVMVLKSVPFNSSSYSDPYYSRLIKKDTSGFWKIFDSENTLSKDFKGTAFSRESKQNRSL